LRHCLPITELDEVAKFLLIEADGFMSKPLRLSVDQKRLDQNGQILLLEKFDNPLVLEVLRFHVDLLFLRPPYKENGGLF
jgi:hypothetical protein